MQATPLGIDISDQVIRFLQLAKRRNGVTVTAHGSEQIPPGIIRDGVITSRKPLVAALRKLLTSAAQGRPTGHIATVALPESKAFLKVIDVPPSRDTALRKNVLDALPQHVPLPIDEVYVDWKVMNSRADGTTNRVFVGACPKTIVDEYVATLTDAGLHVNALEIESLAIARAAIPAADQRSDGSAASVVVDIGRNRCSYILFDNNVIPFTTSSTTFASNHLTQTIGKVLKLKEAEAEKAKRICGLDPTCAKGQVAKSLREMVTALVSEVRLQMQYYRREYPKGNPVKRVLLTGGGSNLLQLPEVLEKRLKTSVRRADLVASSGLRIDDASDFLSEIASYPTAIGLALRHFEDHENA